jgi:hypothetical protein
MTMLAGAYWNFAVYPAIVAANVTSGFSYPSAGRSGGTSVTADIMLNYQGYRPQVRWRAAGDDAGGLPSGYFRRHWNGDDEPNVPMSVSRGTLPVIPRPFSTLTRF